MNKVYAVFESWKYEGDTLLSIWSTKELAELARGRELSNTRPSDCKIVVDEVLLDTTIEKAFKPRFEE